MVVENVGDDRLIRLFCLLRFRYYRPVEVRSIERGTAREGKGQYRNRSSGNRGESESYVKRMVEAGTAA